MRLTFINASHPAMPCGVGDYAAKLAAAAAASGHEVVMFTSSDPRVRVPTALSVYPVFRDWTVTEFLRHYRKIRATRPQAVVLQYPSVLPGPHSRLLFLLPVLTRALLPGTRVILVVHEFARTHPAARRQLALAFAFTHEIVAVNPADVAAIRARMPWAARRTRLAGIGSNIPRVEGAPKGGGPLFFFGLLQAPEKGFDDLLEALARVHGAELEVSGSLDPSVAYHREVEERIGALGLERRVRWLGYLEPEELSRRLQGASLVVLPFRDGAASNRTTVAAALLNGAALVTTRGPDVPDHLRDGENVALVPPADPAALAAALERLLGDGAARERLRAGALASAGRYDWRAVAAETLGAAVRPPQGDWPTDGLEPTPTCPACGAGERRVLYAGLRDRVSFVAPGAWTLYRCSGCGAAYPDPRPSQDTIGIAYGGYYTHAVPAPPHEAPPGALGKVRWALANGYVNARYDYEFAPATRLGACAAPLFPRRRWLADMRVRHLEHRPGARVLDVGCGNGPSCATCLRRAGRWRASTPIRAPSRPRTGPAPRCARACSSATRFRRDPSTQSRSATSSSTCPTRPTPWRSAGRSCGRVASCGSPRRTSSRSATGDSDPIGAASSRPAT